MHVIKRIIKKIKRETVYSWQQIRQITGLNDRFFKAQRGCRIVCYHGICIDNHTKFNGIFLRKATFEKHLQFYKKYFHIVSLEDFYKGNFAKHKFNVCITFDDGYYNNYKYVLPLMNNYKMPVTFFITAIRAAGYDILWNDFLGIVTKYGPKQIQFYNEIFIKQNIKYISVDTKQNLRDIVQENDFKKKEELMRVLSAYVSFRDKKEDQDFWLQMTTEEIKSLSDSPYATIGAHGFYHNDLSRLPLNDCKTELTESKDFLEKICSKKIDSVAFPYGNYTREVRDVSKEAGYNKLLALNYLYEEDKTDEMIRERIIINPYISIINQMFAIVKGMYE